MAEFKTQEDIINLINENKEYEEIIEDCLFYYYSDVCSHGDVVIKNILKNIFHTENNIIKDDDNRFYEFVYNALNFFVEIINKLEIIINEIDNKIHTYEEIKKDNNLLELLKKIYKSYNEQEYYVGDTVEHCLFYFVYNDFDNYELKQQRIKNLNKIYNIIMTINTTKIINEEICISDDLIKIILSNIFI